MIVYVTIETVAAIEYTTASTIRPGCVSRNQRARAFRGRVDSILGTTMKFTNICKQGRGWKFASLILALGVILWSETGETSPPPGGVAPVLAPAGGFSIDGDLLANTPGTGAGDWMLLTNLFSGAGGGISPRSRSAPMGAPPWRRPRRGRSIWNSR